jgi:cytochrome c-type biogenesis protein
MNELVAAFLAGLGSTAAPCIIPLYPGFLAYLTGSSGASVAADGSAAMGRRFSPVLAASLVLAGVLSGMLVIAGLVIALSASLSRVIPVVLPIADGVLIVLGILLVAGINPFARLPQPSPAVAGGRGPAFGAFLYGLLFAPIAIPCIGPFVLAIFAYSLTLGDALSQLLFFVVYGLGFGIPLFVMGLLGQWRGAQLARWIARNERRVQLVMGVALVAVGAWDLTSSGPALLDAFAMLRLT